MLVSTMTKTIHNVSCKYKYNICYVFLDQTEGFFIKLVRFDYLQTIFWAYKLKFHELKLHENKNCSGNVGFVTWRSSS